MFEIRATKADAIDKFRQMQGFCKEEISGGNLALFKCSKKGKIIITCNPSNRRRVQFRSIRPLAKIVEQDGKTYADYCTEFSRSNGIINSVLMAIDVLFIAFVLPFLKGSAILYFMALLLLSLVYLGYSVFGNIKEKENLSKDSEIMVKELEKRIEAINLWNK